MNLAINTSQLFNKLQFNTFIDGYLSCTYGQFFEQVQAVTVKLRSLGIEEGNIVIIYDLPALETLYLFFALFNLKAVALPVDPKISDRELHKIKNLSFARCIITSKVSGDDKIHPMDIFKNVMPASKHAPFSPPNWDLKIPAIIILTSGSSGDPKMVVHSLSSLIYSAKAVNAYFDLHTGESWLLSLPLYHVSGLAVVFRCLLRAAILIIPHVQSDIKTSIIQFKPSLVSLVSTQLRRLLNNEQSTKALKNCRAVFVGGSAVSPSLIKQSIKNNLSVYTSYGLTEMASTVAVKKITDLSTDNAEILQFYQVKISKKNEILLKGKSMFLGYLKDGRLDKNNIKNGWFCTGDLGTSDGHHVTVWGRIDNMFISGGENIYPEEIEKHLLTMKEIENAVVIAADNDEYGQRPVAFIKVKSHINENELRTYLKKFLPSYKIPDRFLPWPEKYNESDIKLKRQYFKSWL